MADAETLPEQSPRTPEGPQVTPQMVRGKVQDFLRSHEQRRKLFPCALVVGVLAGVLATGFRLALAGSEALRGTLIADIPHLTRRFRPKTSNSLPHSIFVR